MRTIAVIDVRFDQPFFGVCSGGSKRRAAPQPPQQLSSTLESEVPEQEVESFAYRCSKIATFTLLAL